MMKATGRDPAATRRDLVTLTGSFVGQHRKEWARFARNNEAKEKRAHPLRWIMDVEDHPDSVVITTTATHLPHR